MNKRRWKISPNAVLDAIQRRDASSSPSVSIFLTRCSVSLRRRRRGVSIVLFDFSSTRFLSHSTRIFVNFLHSLRPLRGRFLAPLSNLSSSFLSFFLLFYSCDKCQSAISQRFKRASRSARVYIRIHVRVERRISLKNFLRYKPRAPIVYSPLDSSQRHRRVFNLG